MEKQSNRNHRSHHRNRGTSHSTTNHTNHSTNHHTTGNRHRHKKNNNHIAILCLCLIAGVALLLMGNAVFSHTKAAKNPTPEPQATAAAEIPKVKTDVFENTAFLGNSCVEMLKTYGIPQNTDFYSRVGLTVETVFTKTMVNSDTLVIDNLNNTNYDDIFLVFGENELGWSYSEVFTEDYLKLIDAVKTKVPKANIYVMSILPVSDKKSEENEDNTNNQRIGEYNSLLEDLAKNTGVNYVAPATGLLTENGTLKEEASTDGIHLNSIYCQIWVDNLKSILKEEQGK
ncbi:MAG: GDSL-type esterase/lipase family protein [Clostridiales bacterium]